jgi:DegV family protein with EDD domain
MPKIALMTDTDCNLPEDLTARYQIQQVPITVQFGQESYLTGVGIDDATLFERIDHENKLPSTAAPSPGQFLEAFDKALAAGADTVLCFTVSSAISATYNNAVNALQMLPDRDITVIDTHAYHWDKASRSWLRRKPPGTARRKRNAWRRRKTPRSARISLPRSRR